MMQPHDTTDSGVTITIGFDQAKRGAEDMVDTAMSEKVDRKTVNYRPCDSQGECCSACASWEGSDQDSTAGCKIVGGKVDADSVCDRFSAAGEGEQQDEQDQPDVGDEPGGMPA